MDCFSCLHQVMNLSKRQFQLKNFSWTELVWELLMISNSGRNYHVINLSLNNKCDSNRHCWSSRSQVSYSTPEYSVVRYEWVKLESSRLICNWLGCSGFLFLPRFVGVWFIIILHKCPEPYQLFLGRKFCTS